MRRTISPWSNAALIAVGMCAGATQFTRIPCSARSTAIDRLKCTTAALAARYATSPAPGLIPPIDVVLTIAPPPLFAMCRAARWLPSMTPRRFTAVTRSKSRRSSSRKRRNAPPIPALLNITWRPPKRATVKSTSSWTSSALATSVRLNAAAGPSRAAAASPRAASTSATTTCAPSSTKSSTVASPIPLAPPVTIATFPWSSRPTASGPVDAVDSLDPVQDRAMHHPPGVRAVRDRPVHHAAIVPDQRVTDLPFVAVHDFPPRRVGAELRDERPALRFRDADDVVDGHAEDEGLASRSVAPDEGMLLDADPPGAGALRLRVAPARDLVRARVGIRGAIRRLEAVHDAQRFAGPPLVLGQVVVGRIGVAELGLPARRREPARGEHRRLGGRAVLEEPVDVPIDRGLQVLRRRILARIERDLEDHLLGAVGALATLRHHVAEVSAERHLLVVVEADAGEEEHAEALERVAAFARERGIENLLATDRDLRADPGRQGDEAVAHAPSPSVSL